jgi:hypothetical protein
VDGSRAVGNRGGSVAGGGGWGERKNTYVEYDELTCIVHVVSVVAHGNQAAAVGRDERLAAARHALGVILA